MNEDQFDVWDLQDVLDALAEMRADLVQTMLVCFASVFLCETMVVARGGVAAFVFTALAVASVVVALVQTANCAAEIIRLEQLVTWATKVAVGPAVSRGIPPCGVVDPATPSEGGASCRVS